MHDQDGNVKQERAYGPAGDVLDDLDWGHGGTHVFPHRHGWVNGKRDKIGVPFQGPPPPPMSASGWVIAGTILYWTISEGSRVVFPPRSLIPIP